MTQTRAPSDETGATLIEVLVAIVILGTAFAAILGGMATSILTSDIHRKEASANTVLVSAAESITDEGRNPYVSCAGTASYRPYLGVSVPPSFTVVVAAVQHWNGAGVGNPDASSPFGAPDPCPAVDTGLQQVTLRAIASDGRATEEISVLKRRPA